MTRTSGKFAALRPFVPFAFFLMALAAGVGTRPARAEDVQSATNMIVICPATSPGLDLFAAREIVRMVYLRTGQILPVVSRDSVSSADHSVIVVADANTALAKSAASNLHLTPPSLAAQNFWLRSASNGADSVVVVVGGDGPGTLYGAYHLGEHLDIRFYLDREVVPDERIALRFPAFDETNKPLFALRGILPFHDFPEGPDWWEPDDYQAVVSSLPKMGMNFFSLHTYSKTVPNGELMTGSEPNVWVGLPKDVGTGGQVKAGYASGYFNTADTNWGYFPRKTSGFGCGASQLFEMDDYTVAPAQWPGNGGVNSIFKSAGTMISNSFALAHQLGIKTCIGTEAPLPVPNEVADRLMAMGRDPWVPTSTEMLYEGAFAWITNTYPLDYYWLWTPERWTWHPVGAEEVELAVDDIEAAVTAWQRVKPNFMLATAGWVMGPQQDRILFDKMLPKSFPISCINSLVGYTPVDPGFAKVTGRPKWEISWLEDDQALTAPQLWAARVRRDAVDALHYGCDGLMGIHWRTRELDPAMAALAQAAWSQTGWSENWKGAGGEGTNVPAIRDFYLDWATHEFGPEAGPAAADIFTQLDNNLPRPAGWLHGPGFVKVETNTWAEMAGDYKFVDQFAGLASKVKGAGAKERFEWWLNSFEYMRGMAQVSCIWADAYNAVVFAGDATNLPIESLRKARDEALPLRRQLITNLTAVYGHLLATVSTPGELGTIANWEQHIFPTMLGRPAFTLTKIMGQELPADALMPMEYTGPLRIIVPTQRTSYAAGENLSVKIMELSPGAPVEPVLHWRALGQGEYHDVPAKHIARGVFRAALPAEATQLAGLEYYITVGASTHPQATWPASAPMTGQTLSKMEK